MKPVAVGADHAGFLLKEEVKAYLDHPDYAAAVAEAVASGTASRAALQSLAVWLETPCAGGCHLRRLDKLARVERGLLAPDALDALHGAPR